MARLARQRLHLYDIGAGWIEPTSACEPSSTGEVDIPVDGGISDADLNEWVPERQVEFSVALEILEHSTTLCVSSASSNDTPHAVSSSPS